VTGALSACPHCGETLKKSAFGTGNALLTDAEVELINSLNEEIAYIQQLRARAPRLL